IRSRKGHYRELFQQIAKQGFVKVRIDGEIRDLVSGMKLDRYKTHDIEIVIDRLEVDASEQIQNRLAESIKTAMYHGEDILMVLPHQSETPRFFSRHLMCPTSGISYPIPEPNSFSFNSPKGACPVCNGLGTINEINLKKIIPDENVSIKMGGIVPIGDQKNTWIFKQLEVISQRYNFKLTDPIKNIPVEAMEIILNGGKDSFSVASKILGITKEYKIDFEGISNFIKNQYNDAPTSAIKRWASDFMDEIVCPECNGSRLRKESLYFKINDKNIS